MACLLMWSSFYDDYILFSTPQLARSSEMAASALFGLLGWDYAKDGRKCVPFADQCEALGVIFNLQESGKGACKISNTPSGIADIAEGDAYQKKLKKD